MKQRIRLMSVMVICFCLNAYSQIELKTEYLAPRRYENNQKDKTSGYGSSMSTSLMARQLIGVQRSNFQTPKLWFLTLNSSYTSLYNSREAKAALPDEMANFDIGVQHIRPLKENLSLVTGASVGIYSTHVEFDDLRGHNLVGAAYGSLVWSLGYGLELGIGMVVNNVYKYPVPIPTPYLKWYREFNCGFVADVDLSYNPKVSFGYKFSESTKISIVNRPRRFFAFAKDNGRDMLYEHAYVTVAIEPEFTFGNLSIPISIGGNFARLDRYRPRKPITVYHMHTPNFNPSFYGAVAIKFNFGR